MHIRLYIVTYKSHERLRQTLQSLFDSDIDTVDLEIFIINNHTDFRIDEEFEDRVTVLHNTLRPDWSNGYLPRNWNQALLLGFEDLSDPACDAVVTAQDDTIFAEDWCTKLTELHEEYSLVQNGLGDQLMSYRPEAVRRIGLWDERFIFSMHVQDYLYRAIIYNRDGTTINDAHGDGRLMNPIVPDDKTESMNYLVNADPREIDEAWDQSSHSRRIGKSLMEKKYGSVGFEELKRNPLDYSRAESYVFYPYFEEDVYNLDEKNYLWGEDFDRDGDVESLFSKQAALVSDQIDLILEAVYRSPIPSTLERLGVLNQARYLRDKVRTAERKLRASDGKQ